MGASLFYIMFFENSHTSFFGWNGQGGNVLDMKTHNSTYDNAYNREFQRMCYLYEGSQVEDSDHAISNEVLASYGAKVTVEPITAVAKRSPHYKYF